MLPFLRDKRDGAAAAPVETVRRVPDSMEYDTLSAVAEDILRAMEAGDASRLKAALQALCDHIQMLDREQDKTM